jgi:prevent-host-death family protein
LATTSTMPQLLTIDQLAEQLSVSVRHVRRLVAERRVPFLKVFKFVRFDPNAIAEWLDRNRVAGRALWGGRPDVAQYDRVMAVTIDELARRAGAVVDEVARTRLRTVITDHGRPVAAIVPLDELDDGTEELAGRLVHRGEFAALRPEGRSVVDEFLADRRREAADEDAR